MSAIIQVLTAYPGSKSGIGVHPLIATRKKKRKKYKYSCARKKSNSHQKLLNNLKLSMVGNVGFNKNQFAHDHATVVPIIYYTQVGLSFGNYDENV